MTKRIEIPKGYKLTKVGVIPDDWEVEKLSELGDLKNGINKDKNQFGYGYPLVNLNDVFENKTNHDKQYSLVNSNKKEQELYSLCKGDVLFARSSVKPTGVGLTSVIEKAIEKAVFSGFLIRFRDHGTIDLEYKKHCFHESGFRKRLLSKSTISANTNINQVALNSLKIPLPPLPEQQQIASILSTWDKAISTTQSIIDELKLRNKGLAQQLLSGKMRLTGFEGKWESLRIGDVTEKFSKRNKELVDARVYSVTNYSGFVLQSEHFSREVAGEDLTSYKIISKGEFAYNPARINVGSIAYFNKEDKGVISSLYVCFRTNDVVIDKFISYWINLDKTHHDFGRYGEGGVRIYLWYDLFAKIKIQIPPLEEQEAIIKILNIADRELKLYEKKLATLKAQKKGLMQKLLTGEIRVHPVQ